MMMNKYGLAGWLLTAATATTTVWAGAGQQDAAQSEVGILHLAASGRVQVQQDWLQMHLQANRQADAPAQVQQQLQLALEQALEQLRPQAQPERLQLQSTGISIWPRQGQEGAIVGWQGRAELLVQGRDFAHITQAVAGVASMELGHMAFSLSPQAQQQVLQQAQSEAVAAFAQRAQQLTHAFGYQRYQLRQVQVNHPGAAWQQPRLLKAAMASPELAGLARAPGAQPMPLEPGSSEVVVEISGSVQMR